MNDTVDILLSVYDPNMEYLRKQLQSLDRQTYSNIRVLIYDDCPKHRTDPEVFRESLTRIPYECLPYEEENVGYTAAFERLIRSSDADYIAFCDQDDIWREDKIETAIRYMKEGDYLLVTSDKKLIDGEDRIICESVRKTSRNVYDTWKSGDDICKYNLFLAYAVGMTLVGRGDFIRSTLPLSTHTGHDKWILCCASTEGKVGYIEDTLVQYRRHGNNVSGIMVGIESKEDYYNKRVLPNKRLAQDLFTKYPDHKDKKEILEFVDGRVNHRIFKVYKHRGLSPNVAKFEIAIALVPNFIFRLLLKYARKHG